MVKFEYCELPAGHGDINKLTPTEYKKYKKPNQKKKLTWEQIGFKEKSEDKIKNYARYVPEDCAFIDLDDMKEALEFLKIVRLMKYRCRCLVTQHGMQFLFRKNKNKRSFCRYKKQITGIDNWLGMNTDVKGSGGVQNIRVYGNQRKEFESWDPIFLSKGEFASDEVKDISTCESMDTSLLDEMPFWALPKECKLFKDGKHGEAKTSDDEIWVRGGKAFSPTNEKGELVKLESHTPLTVLKTMIQGDRHMYIFKHCAYFCMSNGFSLDDYKETLQVINKCYFRFNGGEMTDADLIGDADKRWSEYEEILQNSGYIWDEEKYCWKESWKKDKKKIKSITAKELASMKLPKPYVVVENLLGQGLCVLAGQRKLGKSWMILDLCYCVCTGQPFLGFKTTKSACLYLALEDSENRLQERMKKVFGGDEPNNLHFLTKCAPLDNGLIEELEKNLKEHSDIKLIVIDTFQKVRGAQGRNQNTYDYDYKEMGKLKEFADEHKICILLVHHFRKMKDYSDPFNNISGSTGITGAADTSIILYKNDFKESNVYFATQSRDFDSIERVLFFDKFKWSVISDFIDLEKEKDELAYRNNPTAIAITTLLEKNPEGLRISSTKLYKSIIEITGTKPKQKTPNALTRYINEHLQYDLLAFDGIYYEPPNENGGSSGRDMFFSIPKNSNI